MAGPGVSRPGRAPTPGRSASARAGNSCCKATGGWSKGRGPAAGPGVQTLAGAETILRASSCAAPDRWRPRAGERESRIPAGRHQPCRWRSKNSLSRSWCSPNRREVSWCWMGAKADITWVLTVTHDRHPLGPGGGTVERSVAPRIQIRCPAATSPPGETWSISRCALVAGSRHRFTTTGLFGSEQPAGPGVAHSRAQASGLMVSVEPVSWPWRTKIRTDPAARVGGAGSRR